MPNKTIKFIPKHTASNTNYRTISEEDMKFLQEEFIRWIVKMGEISIQRDPDSKWVFNQWWNKRTATLPYSRTGQNTPASFVSGVLANTMFGEQRDLTDKQMDALQSVSHIMGNVFDDCSTLKFMIGFEYV
jgi:hypothetical protein